MFQRSNKGEKTRHSTFHTLLLLKFLAYYIFVLHVARNTVRSALLTIRDSKLWVVRVICSRFFVAKISPTHSGCKTRSPSFSHHPNRLMSQKMVHVPRIHALHFSTSRSHPQMLRSFTTSSVKESSNRQSNAIVLFRL